MNGPAIIVLGAGGSGTARRIAAGLEGVEIHGLAHRIDDADVGFDDTMVHLRALFAAGRPVIGLCATGILIRALGPHLSDKTDEPPVIAVAEDGSAVIPLLGGHRGANDLARRIADMLDTAPAITTAGDLRFGVALDDPPAGWSLANPDHVKSFMAAMLAGETVRVVGDAPFLDDASLPRDEAGRLRITVSPENLTGDETHLVFHPRRAVVGVGCERGADPAEVTALVQRALSEANIAPGAVAALCSLDLKSDEPAVHAAAAALGVEARFFDAATLEAETPRLANPSEIVFREVGCHGVAEGTALAATGADGVLVFPKIKSERATCAVALAPVPVDTSRCGRPRGRVVVVGTGPGGDGWMTAESEAAISEATDLVGYSLYLDLLGGRADGKSRHDFPLGEETDRVRAALDLAAQGRTVALVSSGDPGIYAMASLVFDQIETGGRDDWGRVAVEICPGISALQAAAARAGAPLGHDFCTVSLSDLLTPWEAIERRIRSAADGDFVIAFYNPVSQRRTWQLAAARDILLAARPPETPVVIARNLGRDGEAVRTTTLRDLDPAEIDMLTVVLVGSSETRAVPRGDGRAWVYTPRGYAGKDAGAKSREGTP